MKNNQILFPLLSIGIGIILLFARKKSETYTQFIGYTAIFCGLSYFVYSSKAILLSMYQKFIQDEVNIQLQQPKKQNYKQQSKKKINNRLEVTQKQTHYLKSQLQKQAEQLQQQESESGSQSDDYKLEEQKLEAAKLQEELEKQKQLEQEKVEKLQKQRQETIKNDKKQIKKNSMKDDQKQETNQQKQTQVDLSSTNQNLKSEPNQEKKSKKVNPDQLLRFQSQPEENDEEWLEVSNKKKNNQLQKEKKASQSNQQNILNETQSTPQVQNLGQQLNQQQKYQNSLKLQPEQLQNQQKNQQASEKQSEASIKNPKQELLQKQLYKQETQSLINQATNQQQVANSKSQEEIKKANKLQKKKEKKLEAEKVEQDDEDWIQVKSRIKPISTTEEQVEELAQQEQKEKKKKGLFTQEEYQKLQEEAKKIEQTYKLRIQQIEEINRIKYIQKTTQYQVKGAEDILKNPYIVAPPKIEYSLPEIKPKLMTREEIDQLVEAKLPKKKIVQSNDIFIQRSDVAPKVVKEAERKKQFKSKITLLKKNEQEVKENLVYTDTPVAFQNNSDQLKPFFSFQIQLQFNITGKELFGRVKRYRRPIYEKKQNEDVNSHENQKKEDRQISEITSNSQQNEMSDKKQIKKGKVQFDEEPKYLIKPENQITTSTKEVLNKSLKSAINNTSQLQKQSLKNENKIVQKVKEVEEKAQSGTLEDFDEDTKNQKNQKGPQDQKAVNESNRSEEKDTQNQTKVEQISNLKSEKNKQEQEKQLPLSQKYYVPKEQEQVGLKKTKLSKQKNQKSQGNDIYVPKQEKNNKQVQIDYQDQNVIYVAKSQIQEGTNSQEQKQQQSNQNENKQSDNVIKNENQDVDQEPEQIEIQIEQQQIQSYDEDVGEILLESCCPDEGSQYQNNLQERNDKFVSELQESQEKQQYQNIVPTIQEGSEKPNIVYEEEEVVNAEICKPLESHEEQQYQKSGQTVQEGSEKPNIVYEEEEVVNAEICKPLESHEEQQYQKSGQTVQEGSEKPNIVYEEEEVVNAEICKPLESHEEQQYQKSGQIVQEGSEKPNIVYEEEEVVNAEICKPLESHEEQQYQKSGQTVQEGSEQPNIVYEEEEVVNAQIYQPSESLEENQSQSIKQKEIERNFQNPPQHLGQKNDNNSPIQQIEEHNILTSNQFQSKQEESSPVNLPPINKSVNILPQIENSQEIFDNSAFLNEIEQKPKILPGVLDLTFNSKTKLINNQIKVSYRKDSGQEQILELETMNLILEGCKEIIADEYIQYLENARKSRRLALQEKQYSEYLSLVLQMGDDQFKITQDGFNFLANSLNIQEEVFQNSFVFYSQHDEYSDEFVEQLTFVQQNMKDIPPTKHTIRKRQGIELIEFQISVIENYTQNEYFNEVLRIFREQETPKEVLPILLNSVIDDIIFEKYGYEEEDKIRFLKQYHNDKEIRSLTEKMETMVEILFDVKME